MNGFDTRPTARILRAMQAEDWSVYGALAELVDNGYGSGRGNAQSAHITHDTKNRTLTVLDNGQGMSELGRLFQLGSIENFSPDDIGQYGAGGTKAILWLASKVEVWTLRDGKISHDSVNWEATIRSGIFPIISDVWKKSTLANTPASLFDAGHGTLIKLHLLRERTFVPSNVKRDLARTYAPGLRLGKQLAWTTIGKNGGTATLADPLIMPDDPAKTVRLDLVVEHDDKHLAVRGEIGLIKDLALNKSNVTIGFGPRVIAETKDCYQSPDGSERFTGAGVAGWLDLGQGWQSYLTTTKRGMNDRPAWDALMGYIYDRIKPLLKEGDADKLSVELDGIAMMLESALDGKARVEVASLGKRRQSEDGEETAGRREGTDEPDHEEEPSSPANLDPTDEAGDDATQEKPSTARIEIVSLDENDMDGLLCFAEIVRDNVAVYVNQDHELVKKAMVSKPVNRSLLNHMVVREIAVEISDKPEIMKRIFTRRVFAELNDRNGRQRERLLTRILMDSVKRVAA